MHRNFLGLHLFQCRTASVEAFRVGIEYQCIGACIRHADPVVLSADRHEIADRDDLIAAVVNAAECDHALPVIVIGDPAEALPRVVVFPERRRLAVEPVECLGKFQQRSVIRIIQHEPLEPCLEIPLSPLAELLSHKEQLLAGMREHIAQECAVGREFLLIVPGHLLDHRTFAVHDLVMRDRQDIVLGEAVEEREGQLVVIECAVQRIHGHIREHIVHPAHVPLEIEAQSADVGRLCDERPRGRFLCDHQHIGVPRKDRFIELLQEIDCFEILSAAVDIRTPFAVSAVIVQIQHGRDGIHAQAVDVERIQPPARRGDQERADLRAAVIEYSGAPALVLALERVGVFV